MSLDGDLYAAILALKTADSGSGGLSEAGGTAQIRTNDWFRTGDPDWRNNKNKPAVEVDTRLAQEDDTFSLGRCIVPVRMHLYVQRNTGMFTKLDAIDKRIRTVFHRAALTASSDWGWSAMSLRRRLAGPTDRDTVHEVYEFEVIATRTTGVA